MKIRLSYLLAFLLLAAMLAACTQPAAETATNQPTVNVQATTDLAVQPTVAALPPTATPVMPVDELTLSEEELAALIDQAVAEAVKAAEATVTTAADTTADEVLSDQEVNTVQITLAASEQAVTYADALINDYQALYGEYAEEALATMDEMEEDLEAMAQSLAEISAVLNQGSQQATAALEKLNASLEAAQPQADALQEQAAGIQDQVQASLDARSGQVLDRQPEKVAVDLPMTVDFLRSYTGAVRAALEDGRVSPAELEQIALLSSNAQASLKQNGGELAQRLSSPLEVMTTQLARGQWPQARAGLDAFERELPNIAPRRP